MQPVQFSANALLTGCQKDEGLDFPSEHLLPSIAMRFQPSKEKQQSVRSLLKEEGQDLEQVAYKGRIQLRPEAFLEYVQNASTEAICGDSLVLVPV